MKILHINSNYEQSSIYSNMAVSIIKDLNVKGKVYYPSFRPYQVNNQDNDLLDNSLCLNKVDRFFYFHRNKKMIKDIENLYNIKKYSVNLAYSLFSNGYIAYTLYKKYGIPYIIIVQNTDVNFYFKKIPFLRALGRKILNKASKVVFISDSYKDFVIENYINNKDKVLISSKSEVIPFGIDSFWINNKIKKHDQSKGMLKLIFVGKVNKNKNITSTIKACQSLLTKGFKIKYTIVGAIEDYRLKKEIESTNFINYIPFTTKEKLLYIYREHDIFIMPSIKESFGLVYGEAMSQGLPVIYTTGQGFDKQFEDGVVGHSVDPLNIKDIAEKILLINENYDCMSDNCIQLVEKFKWSNISLKYINLFKKTIKLKN